MHNKKANGSKYTNAERVATLIAVLTESAVDETRPNNPERGRKLRQTGMDALYNATPNFQLITRPTTDVYTVYYSPVMSNDGKVIEPLTTEPGGYLTAVFDVIYQGDPIPEDYLLYEVLPDLYNEAASTHDIDDYTIYEKVSKAFGYPPLPLMPYSKVPGAHRTLDEDTYATMVKKIGKENAEYAQINIMLLEVLNISALEIAFPIFMTEYKRGDSIENVYNEMLTDIIHSNNPYFTKGDEDDNINE